MAAAVDLFGSMNIEDARIEYCSIKLYGVSGNGNENETRKQFEKGNVRFELISRESGRIHLYIIFIYECI